MIDSPLCGQHPAGPWRVLWKRLGATDNCVLGVSIPYSRAIEEEEKLWEIKDLAKATQTQGPRAALREAGVKVQTPPVTDFYAILYLQALKILLKVKQYWIPSLRQGSFHEGGKDGLWCASM